MPTAQPGRAASAEPAIRARTAPPSPHGGSGRQLSRLFAGAGAAVAATIRWPYPEVVQVLDPLPLPDEAVAIAARFGGTGLIVAETFAARLAHGGQLWFGTPANVGRLLERAAGELGVTVHILA